MLCEVEESSYDQCLLAVFRCEDPSATHGMTANVMTLGTALPVLIKVVGMRAATSLQFFQIFHCNACSTQSVFFLQICIHLADLFFCTKETAFDTAINTVIFADIHIIFPGKAYWAAVDDYFLLNHSTVLISLPQVICAL